MNRKDNAARMLRIVTAFHSSESSLNKFAEIHGISKWKLQYWVRRLGKSSTKGSESLERDQNNFIPIDLPYDNTTEPLYIIINKPCGTQIKIPI